MIASSICSIVTASVLTASVQAASQGAGQIRPVISGRLLVASRRRKASCQSPLATSSFHSGIRFAIGQPIAWQ